MTALHNSTTCPLCSAPLKKDLTDEALWCTGEKLEHVFTIEPSSMNLENARIIFSLYSIFDREQQDIVFPVLYMMEKTVLRTIPEDEMPECFE